MANVWYHVVDGYFGEYSDVVVEEAFNYAKANFKYPTPVISDFFKNNLCLNINAS